MDYLPMKILVLSVIALATLAMSGCEKHSAVFSELRLIQTGLHFPRSQEQLARCKAIEDESCLKVFETVRAAKEKLLSMDRDQALRLTLDTIFARCDEATEDKLGLCRGAINALYFFSSPEEDEAIQTTLSRAPTPILKGVIRADNIWLAKRTNKQLWRQWVMALKANALEKKKLLQTLEGLEAGNLSIDLL